MKVVALIQARMNSTRLPKKIMMDIKSNPMIYYLISRLKLSKKINQIVLATTENSLDDNLVEFVSSIGVDIFRGRENNVLDRFYNAAKKFEADIVIRITADCPLIDPYLVDTFLNDSKRFYATFRKATTKEEITEGYLTLLKNKV